MRWAVLLAVLACLTAAAAADADPADTGGTGAAVRIDAGALVTDLTSIVFTDGDHVVYDAKGSGGGGAGIVTRDGFSTYGDTTVRDDGYQVVLIASDGVEQIRPFVEAAAAAAVAAGAPPLDVMPGALASGAEPRRGQIHVRVSASAPCAGSWLGCGGPIIDDGVVQAGRIWINPRLLRRGHHEIDNTVRHELGHTLGLGHYGHAHEGRTQTMHPTRFDAHTYESGDRAGFGFVTGRRPSTAATAAPPPPPQQPPPAADAARPPADDPTAPPPARETADPVGELDSVGATPMGLVVRGWASDPDGSVPVRVLVTVDGAPFEVVAHRARPDGGPIDGFEFRHPAPPGSHEVCVLLRNQAAGADTSLGCRQVEVSARSISSVGLQTL